MQYEMHRDCTQAAVDVADTFCGWKASKREETASECKEGATRFGASPLWTLRCTHWHCALRGPFWPLNLLQLTDIELFFTVVNAVASFLAYLPRKSERFALGDLCASPSLFRPRFLTMGAVGSKVQTLAKQHSTTDSDSETEILDVAIVGAGKRG
jgi:hypothetical protein